MWQNEFHTLLESEDDQEVARGYTIKDANLPDVLCKYRASNEMAMQNLRDDTIWLSPPSQFNDPYDTSLSVDAGPALAEILRRGFEIRPLPSLDKAQMEKVVTSADPIGESSSHLADLGKLTAAEARQLQEMVRQASEKFTHDITALGTAKIQETVKACSFTTLPLSMGMWSHYADQHRGLCILYSTASLDAGIRGHLYPVMYTPRRFSLAVHFLRFVQTQGRAHLLGGNHLISAAIRKSPDWAYENEWRLVFIDNGHPSGLCFPMPTPTAIYLGAKMPSKVRRDILEIAAKKGIACYDVALSDASFELRALPVSP